MKKYVITGKDVNGKRFKIETETPQHYNIFCGSLWELGKDGKRKLILRYHN